MAANPFGERDITPFEEALLQFLEKVDESGKAKIEDRVVLLHANRGTDKTSIQVGVRIDGNEVSIPVTRKTFLDKGFIKKHGKKQYTANGSSEAIDDFVSMLDSKVHLLPAKQMVELLGDDDEKEGMEEAEKEVEAERKAIDEAMRASDSMRASSSSSSSKPSRRRRATTTFMADSDDDDFSEMKYFPGWDEIYDTSVHPKSRKYEEKHKTTAKDWDAIRDLDSHQEYSHESHFKDLKDLEGVIVAQTKKVAKECKTEDDVADAIDCGHLMGKITDVRKPTAATPIDFTVQLLDIAKSGLVDAEGKARITMSAKEYAEKGFTKEAAIKAAKDAMKEIGKKHYREGKVTSRKSELAFVRGIKVKSEKKKKPIKL